MRERFRRRGNHGRECRGKCRGALRFRSRKTWMVSEISITVSAPDGHIDVERRDFPGAGTGCERDRGCCSAGKRPRQRATHQNSPLGASRRSSSGSEYMSRWATFATPANHIPGTVGERGVQLHDHPRYRTGERIAVRLRPTGVGAEVRCIPGWRSAAVGLGDGEQSAESLGEHVVHGGGFFHGSC